MGLLQKTPAQPIKTAPAQSIKPAAAPKTGAKPAQRAPAAASFDETIPRGTRDNLLPIDDYTSATYVLKINQLSLIFREESKNPSKAESTTATFEVVESNNPKCPPGYQASATFTDRYFQDLYWQDVKGMLCGILGMEPKDVTRDVWHSACGRRPEGFDDQQWAETEEEVKQMVIGALVRVTVKFKLREGKHPITQYVWAPYLEAAE